MGCTRFAPTCSDSFRRRTSRSCLFLEGKGCMRPRFEPPRLSSSLLDNYRIGWHHPPRQKMCPTDKAHSMKSPRPYERFPLDTFRRYRVHPYLPSPKNSKTKMSPGDTIGTLSATTYSRSRFGLWPGLMCWGLSTCSHWGKHNEPATPRCI